MFKASDDTAKPPMPPDMNIGVWNTLAREAFRGLAEEKQAAYEELAVLTNEERENAALAEDVSEAIRSQYVFSSGLTYTTLTLVHVGRHSFYETQRRPHSSPGMSKQAA